MTVRMTEITDRIDAEILEADRLYAGFTSSHEGLGVLTEEMAELVEAIRANDLEAIEREAVQVAAVATRLACCCTDKRFIARSGCKTTESS